ncbi:isoprenyl transferase [Roseospira marina]|uniref:Isoprenyl transferase n=1 Tax=Roseospira marina TaxID=140057 RepID=A0A5M6I8G6_9PROT|nr:isoprenyl transferase [Roseospira marina]KAA5604483.1 isoprenyl transferase [Roseospira marina]MBB4315532.1 undecaprenyl diphosphate synthase [Roseospira marina]MBB5088531.1 undecaprenyl diphosphate synthase [Roseospira marina]
MSHIPAPQSDDGPPDPLHVAIIMDGNGRWARSRGLARTEGHRKGAEAVRATVTGAVRLGVSHLTLFGFSSENWRRPIEEVSTLMGLLRVYLRRDMNELEREGIRLRVIGERDRFSADILRLIEEAERRTGANTRLNLTIALNYGGRAEIVRAARHLAEAVQSGHLSPDSIDEAQVCAALYAPDMPDPDVLIRTSGEQRISNFLLWQIAYAELVFVDAPWPEFGEAHLAAALDEFRARDRRFGAVSG